jgi:hypothetical protein
VKAGTVREFGELVSIPTVPSTECPSSLMPFKTPGATTRTSSTTADNQATMFEVALSWIYYWAIRDPKRYQ